MKVHVTRRRFLEGSTAAAGTLAAPAVFTGAAAIARSVPEPDEILAKITPGNYVKPEYLERFGIGPDDLLWDPKKDWIRNADWEAIRRKFAGLTTHLAIGAADAVSVRDALAPFKQLTGMKVEIVPIPDDALFEVATREFRSMTGKFDAIEYFSPYLGDFAAGEYLAPLEDYIEKWQFPLDDFADTYRLNYCTYRDRVYGIPYDCDIQMVQTRLRPFRDVVGRNVRVADTLRTYDDVLRFAKELNKPHLGFHGIAFLARRGFWATYTWQHIGAQYGLDLFDDRWQPLIDSEASVKAVEIMLALQKSAPAEVTDWGWSGNREAWLGGRTAMNIAWQDQGNQATRPDQSSIWEDGIRTVFEPRGTGLDARFAPPNTAGSTASIARNAINPEAAFLMLAFYTTASLQAMNGANATGVSPGYKSVFRNRNFQKIMEPAKVWSQEVDYCWCAPRIPGALKLDVVLGDALNRVLTGRLSIREALADAKAAWKSIMKSNNFYSGLPPVEYHSIADRLWLGAGKAPPF